MNLRKEMIIGSEEEMNIEDFFSFLFEFFSFFFSSFLLLFFKGMTAGFGVFLLQTSFEISTALTFSITSLLSLNYIR